ncbi:hypothetical protein M422DRAFT_238178 [Sphaerobolus stellatus SS14]|nr:hypothetical protein M422DRAFT_238178 [Sphaerobolus stellatus SS14]
MSDSLRVRVPSHGQRPASSLSNRPTSRTSQRAFSRLSQFSVTKQPRLAALLQTLVKQVSTITPEDEADPDDIQYGVETAIRRIDALKQAPIMDMQQIDEQVAGRILKARINVQDTLAKLLKQRYNTLKETVDKRRDLDMDIKSNTLPAHLQFLLCLSNNPTKETLLKSEDLMDRKAEVPVTDSQIWQTILQEEPFEGEHWRGFYNQGNLDDYAEDLDDELSNLSLSFSDIDYYKGADTTSESEQASRSPHELPVPLPASAFHGQQVAIISKAKVNAGRLMVESLYEKQYWRPSWQPDFSPWNEFDIDSSLPVDLAPAMDSLSSGIPFPSNANVYINEIDVVREVLMLLRGHQTLLFSVEEGNIKVSTTRRLPHLTTASQNSILTWFADSASPLYSLRSLVEETISQGTSSAKVRTYEAFASGISTQLNHLDMWCAKKEEQICFAQSGDSEMPHVVSLLSFKQEVEAIIGGTFQDLLRIAQRVKTMVAHTTSSIVAATILNSLWAQIKTRQAINDTQTAQALLDVWRTSGEPTWRNLRCWIKDGIPIQADFEDIRPAPKPTWDKDEFFVRINPLINPGSPDFWEASYTLPGKLPVATDIRNEDSPYPLFLVPLASDILAAGKAVGLLRAMGLFQNYVNEWLSGWMTFREATSTLTLKALETTVEEAMSNILLESCEQAQAWLQEVLVERCNLWKHLRGIENVCLMVRGDAMLHFSEKLFARMDARQVWNDFHFLNIAFREVATMGQVSWIDPSFVRFSFHGPRDRNINRTVRAMDGLIVEYSTPFPVAYLFGQESIAGYSTLFTFLLQIRRTKSILDNLFLRSLDALNSKVDIKVFYVLRSSLLWFVNTISYFVMTNVIHGSLSELHDSLVKTRSLDEMIKLHRAHLDRLLGRCMLQAKTAALHRAVLSTLDLCLQFNDCLVAFAADTSADISRHSLITMNRNRRRKLNRSRTQNVVGFVENLPREESESESDFSEEEEAEGEASATSSSVSVRSVSYESHDFSTRIERISLELDGLVRFISRGVESLASGAGDSAPTFGMLAFSLQDWR